MTRGMLAGGILALACVSGCGASRHSERVVVPVVRREPAQEVIVVERTHVPRGHAYGWWKQHGYREVTLYTDGGRYYRGHNGRDGFRAVVVYEREGRYYVADEESESKGGSHGRGHGHDKKD